MLWATFLSQKDLGIFSTTFMQCVMKSTEFAKITQNNGHYAVQGYSRSPIFGTNRKPICDFLLVINTNLLTSYLAPFTVQNRYICYPSRV